MQNMVLIKVESALQSGQVGALAGQTATVSKVSAATNLATLVPADGGAGVTIKLDAARQVGELKALLGKTVVVGKSPAVLGGAGNWISLLPVASTAKAGAAASAAAPVVLMQVEGGMAAAQLPGLVGKTVTVAQPQVTAGTKAANMLFLQNQGNLVGLKVQGAMQAKALVGNTYMVMQSPVVGGPIGKYLILQPFSATAAKAAAGGAMAAKFVPAAATTGGKAAVGVSAVAAGSMAAVTTTGGTASPIAAASAGSSMLGAKGVALGVGLGLGAWGPVIVGAVGLLGAVSAYTYVKSRRAKPDVSDDELLVAASGS